MAVDPKAVHTERSEVSLLNAALDLSTSLKNDIVRDKNKTWVNIFIITPINMKHVLLALYVSKLAHIADTQNSVS